MVEFGLIVLVLPINILISQRLTCCQISLFGTLPNQWKRKLITILPKTVVGEAKEVEVEVEVKDAWTLPAPAMFVEWISDGGRIQGTTNYVTGLGTTKNTWHPTEAGTFAPYCYVKKWFVERERQSNL